MHTIWCIFQTLLLALSSAANSESVRSTNVLVEYDSTKFGASPVAITSAPWHVSVRLQSYEGIQLGHGHLCGGSVVTSRVILTAAYCLLYSNQTHQSYRLPKEFTIHMGSVYLHELTPYTLQYNVLELVPHPDFSVSTYENDLGLLFIDGMIPANYPTVAPIALNQVALKPGINCSVTGWGIAAKGINWPVLLGAVLPILDPHKCQNINYGELTPDMLCAGHQTNNGTNGFLGDSGAALVCNGKLSGVLSVEKGYSGVYTNVSAYHNWIVATNGTFDYARYGGAMGQHLVPQQIVLGIFCLLFTLWFSQATYAK